MCRKLCLILTFVVIPAVSILVYFRLFSHLKPDQPWAYNTEHNAIVNPSNHAARNRYNEVRYKPENDSFFQWWNFLVFDAETLDHFTIVYNLASSPEQGRLGNVAIIHRRGSTPLLKEVDFAPLSRIDFKKQSDLYFRSKTDPQKVLHSFEAVGDIEGPNAGVYRCIANLPHVSWDLTFRRRSGYFGANGDDPNTCFIASFLFGYHSVVEGTITVKEDPAKNQPEKVYKIDTSPRYRAYAAGSWGCTFPQGNPPIEYPWTWFWLVIPDTDPNRDVGMVSGTGRFELGGLKLEGGYVAGYLGPVERSKIPTATDNHFSIRYAKFFHNTSLEFLFQASSSHGYFVSGGVEQAEWVTFKDEIGEALIPLVQTFRFVSQYLSVTVEFHATVDQFFRALVVHGPRFFSDFRAVGARTHLVVVDRQSNAVLYDRWVTTMNAVEYAYEAYIAPEIAQLIRTQQRDEIKL